jgi:ABC-type sugar transport system ATPase subunit
MNQQATHGASFLIAVRQLSVVQGNFALRDISFEIPAGAYGVLMGRTGSGKTTLLEVICGLRQPAAGSVFLMERDVTLLKPAERGIGYVPQDRALFATMSVRQHLAFALAVRHWSAPDIAVRVDELAQLLSIGHLLHRYPVGLSGGEAQRVALGRALAMRPGVLLLDEPLSALDEETREGMFTLLQTIRTQTAVTVLHITHSREEARRLADCVLVLRNGQAVPESNLIANSDGAPEELTPSDTRIQSEPGS